MSEYPPVKITVIWNDEDVELRLMKAVTVLFEEAQRLGLDSDAKARVASWLQDRYPFIEMMGPEDA